MTKDKLFTVVILVIFFFGGLFLIGVGASEGWKSVAALGWEKKPGKIVSARIRKFRPAGQRSDAYEAEFFYKYEARGYTGNGKMLYPGYDYDGSLESAGSWVRRFPEGADVTVYMNPEKPKEAMLAPGLHLEHVGRPFAGIMMVLMSLFLLPRVVRGKNG